MKVGLILGVCLFLNVYTDSQLLFKATDFGLAVRQLESQTLGWLFAVATLKSRGWVSLALLLPAQLCHPLGQRWRETEEREADIWTGNVKTHSLQGSHANHFHFRHHTHHTTSPYKLAPWNWQTATQAFCCLLESQCKYSKLACASRADCEASTLDKAQIATFPDIATIRCFPAADGWIHLSLIF